MPAAQEENVERVSPDIAAFRERMHTGEREEVGASGSSASSGGSSRGSFPDANRLADRRNRVRRAAFDGARAPLRRVVEQCWRAHGLHVLKGGFRPSS